MKVFSTTQLRRRAKDILEAAQNAPVMITRYGKPRFVVMSREHFEGMQKLHGRLNADTEIESKWQ